MTEIVCDLERCLHNNYGYCDKEAITINTDKECEDYER